MPDSRSKKDDDGLLLLLLLLLVVVVVYVVYSTRKASLINRFELEKTRSARDLLSAPRDSTKIALDFGRRKKRMLLTNKKEAPPQKGQKT